MKKLSKTEKKILDDNWWWASQAVDASYGEDESFVDHIVNMISNHLSEQIMVPHREHTNEFVRLELQTFGCLDSRIP